MFKGGYILIDCKGFNLLGDPAEVEGIYDQMVKAQKANKPVYAQNCRWGTEEISPIAVLVTYADDHYTATGATLQLVISEDDTVTVNNLVG